MMKRLLRWLLFFIVVGGIVVVFSRLQASMPAPDAPTVEIVDSLIVNPRTFQVVVNSMGLVVPERQVALTFEIPGVVIEILAQVGDYVEAGQVLASVDVTDLQTAVANAELALQAQESAYAVLTSPAQAEDIRVAEAAVTLAQSQLQSALNTGTTASDQEIARLRAELSRNQLWQAQLQSDLSQNSGLGSIDLAGLISDDVQIPQEILDEAANALGSLSLPNSAPSARDTQAGLNQLEFAVEIADANQAAVNSRGPNQGSLGAANAALVVAQSQLNLLLNGPSENQLRLAELSIQQAQLAVEQAALAISRAQIVAPFSGIIALNNLVLGELPPTDRPAFQILDQRQMYVDLSVDEMDIVDIQIGQSVELRFDALPNTPLEGEVSRVTVVPTITGQLVTYPVRVVLNDLEEALRVGMTSTASIVVRSVENALVIPNRFIRIDRTSQQAFVTLNTDGQQFSEIPITLGIRNETESQVVDGLSAGDHIVLLPRGTFDPLTR